MGDLYGHKESWAEGETASFEYHCYESLQSADAHLWIRSHQTVTVLGRGADEDMGGTFEERAAEGMPNLYRVRFEDGLVGDVFEDELLTGPEHFHRPDPPKVPEWSPLRVG